MELRRERILDLARDIIAEKGFDGLNLRDLAEKAGVTKPTIYNLIGDKETLIHSLFEDTVSPFERLTFIPNPKDPISGIESIIDIFIGRLKENESYHRAELLTRVRLEHAGDPVALDHFSRSEKLAIEVYAKVQKAGMSRGQLSSQQLGTQFFRAFRFTYHEWAHGQISLSAFRTQALTDLYFSLAADATPAFHPQLIAKIRSLDRSRRASSRKSHHKQK